MEVFAPEMKLLPAFGKGNAGLEIRDQVLKQRSPLCDRGYSQLDVHSRELREGSAFLLPIDEAVDVRLKALYSLGQKFSTLEHGDTLELPVLPLGHAPLPLRRAMTQAEELGLSVLETFLQPVSLPAKQGGVIFRSTGQKFLNLTIERSLGQLQALHFVEQRLRAASKTVTQVVELIEFRLQPVNAPVQVLPLLLQLPNASHLLLKFVLELISDLVGKRFAPSLEERLVQAKPLFTPGKPEFLFTDGNLALLHFGKSIPCLRKHTLGEGTSCGKQCLALFLNREWKMLTLCLECFHLRSQSG